MVRSLTMRSLALCRYPLTSTYMALIVVVSTTLQLRPLG